MPGRRGKKRSGTESRMFVKRAPKAGARDVVGERITEDLADDSDLIQLQNARPSRGQRNGGEDHQQGHYLSEEDDLADADLLQLSGDDMEDDEDVDDDSDDEDASAQDPNTDAEAKYLSKFGSNRRDHYGADNVDYFDLDEDEALEEEQEARRIQREQLGDLDTEDFEAASSAKSKGQKKKDKLKKKQLVADSKAAEAAQRQLRDAQLVKRVSAELRSVDLDLQDDDVVVDQISKDFSSLSETEKLQLLKRDSPMLLKLLEEFRQKLAEVKQIAEPLARLAKEQPTTQGVSLLQTKVQLMLAYLTNISFFLLLRAEGKSVENHPVVAQLVRIRVMLEKIRPLDKKISYQIEKLLQQAAAAESTGAAVSGSQKDPLSFRANPSALVTDSAGGLGAAGGSDDEDGPAGGSEVYRPPKLPTASLLETEREQTRAKALLERRRKQALRSGLVDQMRAQLDVDAPEVVPSMTEEGGSRQDAFKEEERRRYEEENFLRLMDSKQDRKRASRIGRLKVTGFEDLEDFSSLAALADDSGLAESNQQMELDGLEGDDEEFDGIRSAEYSAALQDYDRADKKNKKRKWEEDAGKSQRKAGREVHYPDEDWDAIEEGERRGAGKQILQNRGLTKSRPRDKANPRIRHRKAFDKAVKRRKSQVREFAGSNPAYGGEKSGIKTNLVKSVQLKQ